MFLQVSKLPTKDKIIKRCLQNSIMHFEAVHSGIFIVSYWYFWGNLLLCLKTADMILTVFWLLALPKLSKRIRDQVSPLPKVAKKKLWSSQPLAWPPRREAALAAGLITAWNFTKNGEAALAADLLADSRTASTSCLGCTWESTENGYSWSGNGAGTDAETWQSELAICFPLMF